MRGLNRAPRVLYVRTEGRSLVSRAERRVAELAGQAPRRVLVEEALGFDLLGESDIARLPGWRGALLRRLPVFVALGLEAARRSRDYDLVLSWAEKYSIAIAAALLLRRNRPRHLAIMDWISKPVVRVPLGLVRRGIDGILTWSSVQSRIAVERIGFSPEQIVRIEHPVDDVFFEPMPSTRDIIFSAGETQRDFATLIDATAGMSAPTVIAASLIGVFGGFRTRLTDARNLELPAGVEVRAMNPEELRTAYAKAKVVVVPLLPADNNAGLSVVLEAMSMGCPVIVTSTRGQVDIVRHGENGLYVPAQDVAALRGAIEKLISDPAYADAIAKAGRRDALERHRVDDFVVAVRGAVADAVSIPRRLTP